MKKLIASVLLFALALTFASCLYSYPESEWQTVEIEEAGTVKLPIDWSVKYEDDGRPYVYDMDGALYVYDKDGALVMAECPFLLEDDLEEMTLGDKYHEKYTAKVINKVFISNSAYYGRYSVTCDGETRERLAVVFCAFRERNDVPSYCCLLIWDDGVSEATAKKIANSFSHD